ncbi:hypothetical protein SOVF_006450 [Spinacia oleracea]|nr:hypothetical protein SOVF_006450 [Spinacia oleracea]
MAHANLPFFFLLFLVFSLSSGNTTGALDENNAEPPSTMTPLSVQTVNRLYFLHQGGMLKKSRKLLEEGDLVELDYDYAGPNPKHDPRKGRGGGHP